MYKNVWCTCIVVLLIKPCPHVSVFIWKREFFLMDTTSIHTYPTKTINENGAFRKRSPEWNFPENAVFTCTCGQSKTELTVNPLLSPPFQRRKVNKPPPYLLSPPPPPPLHPYSSKTINVDWAVMFYSGWKFILFLVFDRITSNFMCWTFSTLRSSSLWRIVTIFLLLEKAV